MRIKIDVSTSASIRCQWYTCVGCPSAFSFPFIDSGQVLQVSFANEQSNFSTGLVKNVVDVGMNGRLIGINRKLCTCVYFENFLNLAAFNFFRNLFMSFISSHNTRHSTARYIVPNSYSCSALTQSVACFLFQKPQLICRNDNASQSWSMFCFTVISFNSFMKTVHPRFVQFHQTVSFEKCSWYPNS